MCEGCITTNYIIYVTSNLKPSVLLSVVKFKSELQTWVGNDIDQTIENSAMTICICINASTSTGDGC